MIEYKKFTLDNGLRVLIHEDKSTPIITINTVFDVGAKDEDEIRTGFAHLFEHLMFGGSVNIPEFDSPLQNVGGQNNAFTSNDITNYYITLPKQNIETGLWLESDRMLSLAFTPESLEVQRSVVIEEFKQRYLNQPYGDVMLLLRPLAYKEHSYKWSTIGKEISHIENAIMQDVKDFFHKHYTPQNAILSIAGDITFEKAQELVTKWYGDIPSGNKYERNLTQEPKQTEARFLEVKRDVPQNGIYKAWHICDRMHKDYYAIDLLSDVLGRGNSSRLYQDLVKDKGLFTEIGAYQMGSMENGLFMVSGKVKEGIDMKVADAAIIETLSKMQDELIDANELTKVKNKVESTGAFGNMNALNKAMRIGYFELLGDANLGNEEPKEYAKVTAQNIQNAAQEYLKESNCSTLYYLSEKK
ncbi:insulinase family protein [bacterium]|nr:insulinase family protein [bacterium]MDB4088304.1 insulinase family protein [Flavobacteriales bacterium]